MSRNPQPFTVQDIPKYHDRPALVNTQGESLTYTQLHTQVHSFADYLRGNGITLNSRVAVLQHKSFESVISILAIRSLGACYIPIDAQLPATRVMKIVADADPNALICDPHLFPSELPCQLEICSAVPGMKDTGGTFLGGDVSTEEWSHIIYTSGSTGVPKGVCISKDAAEAFIRWSEQTFSVTSGEQVASIAPFHFDLAQFDLFATLRQGGTLHLFGPEETKNVRLMAQELSARKISTIYSTPTFFSALTLYGRPEKHEWSAMRKVLFAGEVFPVKPLHQLMDVWKDARFYNLYGPTETNVCTYTEIIRDPQRTTPYPIGKICAGHRYEITSEQELLIGGAHVAGGYLNQPELTAERFFTRDGMRWFRTGDIVSEDNDGNLVYRGRADRMVKRRGYRIEPGEIENALVQLPHITGAAVLSSGEGENLMLTAVVTSLSEKPEDVVEVKSALLQLLPEYMLPDAVHTISEFPLTSSGKIDYVRLQKEIVSSSQQ